MLIRAPVAPLDEAIARDLTWLVDAPDIVTLDGYEGRPRAGR